MKASRIAARHNEDEHGQNDDQLDDGGESNTEYKDDNDAREEKYEQDDQEDHFDRHCKVARHYEKRARRRQRPTKHVLPELQQ